MAATKNGLGFRYHLPYGKVHKFAGFHSDNFILY